MRQSHHPPGGASSERLRSLFAVSEDVLLALEARSPPPALPEVLPLLPAPPTMLKNELRIPPPPELLLVEPAFGEELLPVALPPGDAGRSW